MTPQTPTTQRPFVRQPARKVKFPVGAGEVISEGDALVGRTIKQFAAPSVVKKGRNDVDTFHHKFVGFAMESFDNSEGEDGTYNDRRSLIKVDTGGEAPMRVSGSTPKAGSAAYLVDHRTVSMDGAPNGIVCGQFVRPGQGIRWFVRTSAVAFGFQEHWASYTLPDINQPITLKLPTPLSYSCLIGVQLRTMAANSEAETSVTFSAAVPGQPSVELPDYFSGDSTIVVPSSAPVGFARNLNPSSNNYAPGGFELQISSDGAGSGVLPAIVQALWN